MDPFEEKRRERANENAPLFPLDAALPELATAEARTKAQARTTDSRTPPFAKSSSEAIAFALSQLQSQQCTSRSLPPVLNPSPLFTRAAPFGDARDRSYHGASARIGAYYSIPATHPETAHSQRPASPDSTLEHADHQSASNGTQTSSTSGSAATSDAEESDDAEPDANEEVRRFFAGASDIGDYTTLKRKRLVNTETAIGSAERKQRHAYADAVARLHYYVHLGMAETDVVEPKDEWLRHVMELLPQKSLPGLSEEFYTDFLEQSVEEMRNDYFESIKRSILEYVLNSEAERDRLGMDALREHIRCPCSFKDQPHSRVPTEWREDVDAAREDLAWTLQTLSSSVLELAELWEGHKHRRLLDVSSDAFCGKQPFGASDFRSLQSNAIEAVKSSLWTSWVPKSAEVFRRSPPLYINGDAEAYYRSIAVLQGNELRQLVSDSLQEYVMFFESHMPTDESQHVDPHEEQLMWHTCAAFEIAVRADENTAEPYFVPPLEEIDRQVCEAIDEAALAVRGLPQITATSAGPSSSHPHTGAAPANASSPPQPRYQIQRDRNGHDGVDGLLSSNTDGTETSSNPTIPAVSLDDEEIVSSKERVHQVIIANASAPHELLQLYTPYMHLLSHTGETYMRNVFNNATDLESYSNAIHELRHLEELIMSTSMQSVRTGLYVLDLRSIKASLQDAVKGIQHDLLERVRKTALDSNNKICEDYSVMNEEVLKQSNSTEEMLKLKKYIQKSLQEQDELRAESNMNKKREDFLYRFQHEVSEHDFHVAMKAYEWPKRMVDVMKQATEKANSEHRYFEDELKKRRNSFAEHLSSLQEQIDSFDCIKDIDNREKYAEQVRYLSQKLQGAKEEAEAINTLEKMFGWMQTKYTSISSLLNKLDPYLTLWTTCSSFYSNYNIWMTGPFSNLDPEQVEEQVTEHFRKIYKLVKTFSDRAEPLEVARQTKEKIEEFKEVLPLVHAVCNPGLRERHWQEMSDAIGFDVRPDESTPLQRLIDRRANDHTQKLSEIADQASREFSFERTLDKMENEWRGMKFELSEWKNTGTYILKGGPLDEAQSLLDDHIVKTQAMRASPFSSPFSDRIEPWEAKITRLQEIIDQWLTCQSKWIYLEPIFGSEEIMRQIPTEGKAFHDMEKRWRKIMEAVKANPDMMAVAQFESLLEELQEANKCLEIVEKGLNDFLDTKKLAFPRFFFLSNDELLEILSEGKDPLKIQPYMKKCFEAIDSIEFSDQTVITAMVSVEGEKVPLSREVDPAETGAVEKWMLEFEDVMKQSVHKITAEAITSYPQDSREKWILDWPGQIVLCGSQVYWTKGATEALQSKGNEGLKEFEEIINKQLSNIVGMVRGELSKLERKTLAALVVLDVHNRDVVTDMKEQGVERDTDFLWMAQLRYYWENDTVVCRMINAQAFYAYEYLGNSERLVITPLTDRCYRTLMSAIHLNLGGAPQGPAGTGKTETVKDLAKAIAIQCVVFNCSDGLDYVAMGKFFKGLAASGAWACFDEFNRIELEVLSVVAQQVLTIQRAVAAQYDTFSFEGVELRLIRTVNVFITMNPGYAGRSELPDNLKALFRDVAMMVPDYSQIAEIILFSNGYLEARDMARKLVQTYRLCSEQLSAQDHYDYGMRAVISVLRAAGNLKRKHPNENEDVLMLRAITDVNLPKFLDHDVPLFKGILCDLFPGVELPEVDNKNLLTEVRNVCSAWNLQPLEPFETKVTQLYEMIIVRHGLMIVGAPFGMKTTCYRVLGSALSELNRKGLDSEYFVRYWVLNPKAVTMGQLYGIEDPVSKEWQDGVLAVQFRNAARDTSPVRKWVIFDGPVDAIWIENMNTVLDDNKKLCLNSGEIIAMSGEMNMIFEVEDLQYASPATVSRCGMVYVQPSLLGWRAIMYSWIQTLPSGISAERKEQIQGLFEWLVPPMLRVVTALCNMPQPMQEINLVRSLMSLYESLLDEFKNPKTIEEMNENMVLVWIESLFLFSLVWSIGACVDEPGRRKFDSYLRKLLLNETPDELKHHIKATGKKVTQLFPEGRLVYDFCFDKQRGKWIYWLDTVEDNPIPSDELYQNIIVTTADTVRYDYLLRTLATHRKNVLFVGPTGTGKTVYVKRYLQHGVDHEKYSSIFLNFSAQTSANMTQDIIDGKLDKRKKHVYGPPIGKNMVVFVDDLNMPMVEQYGAQPPIELLRQLVDHGGWYDRKDICFKHLQDLQFVAAMGPPGGGRNKVTDRYLRHYSLVNVTPFTEETLRNIFSKIVSWWIHNKELDSSISKMVEPIVTSTIRIYEIVQAELLPTPMKSHYTFNLRDVSKVFQGICSGVNDVADGAKLCRLWVHELQRVFSDRLINDEDKKWMGETIKATSEKVFKEPFTRVLGKKGGQQQSSDGAPSSLEMIGNITFCDFLVDGQDPPVYREVQSKDELKQVVNEKLNDYNATSKKPMELVMFNYALEHVSRICRILRQPGGHALLVGVGGTGRQSLTKLAAFIEEFEILQIEISKSYSRADWQDDLKRVLRTAGENGKQTVFFFSDTQIKDETFVEDISNLLNTAEVPNLLTSADLVEILENISSRAKSANMHNNRTQLYNFFLGEVKHNLHIVLAFSPVGDAFRERLRKFPSLVTCTTIDWFTAWPEDALYNVADTFLTGANVSDEEKPKLARMCVKIQKSVKELSQRLYDELRRYFYVTPTSFLELITSYKEMLSAQQKEKKSLKSKYTTGLEKLEKTESSVNEMQQELENLKPKLVEARKETERSMQKVQEEEKEANKVYEVVSKDRQTAAEEQEKVENMEREARADLAEAEPQRDEARKKLDNLKQQEIAEVRMMQRPPEIVKLVLEAVCILRQRQPTRVRDSNTGKMVDDYWETSKKMMAEGDFLSTLRSYADPNDKDMERIQQIPQKAIEKVKAYVNDPRLESSNVKSKSQAAYGLWGWVTAVEQCDRVLKVVKPKQEALKQAQEELDSVNASLAEKQAKQDEVKARLDSLKTDLQEKEDYKNKVENDVQQTEVKLDRAQKLIQGLGGEKTRWKENAERLSNEMIYLTGDILLAAAFIAYLGAFNASYRADALNYWIKQAVDEEIPINQSFKFVGTVGDQVKIRQWNIEGLPKDEFSSENGLIMHYGRRWPYFIDPQNQANKWIREMEKGTGLVSLKLTDNNYMRNLENAVQFGTPVLLENVPTTLDASLEPVLLRETFKQSGTTMIRLGDANVEYSNDFRLYITTKLRNPHLSPELCSKVSLINFMITQEGLEDQLLGTIVAKERPDLAEQKNELIVQSADNKRQLREIEDKILEVLSTSEGNVLEDEQAVQVLNDSKSLANDITEKQKVAEETERKIDETRSEYRQVAQHSSHLFFSVTDMANIEYMYQYSLTWFTNLFVRSIETAEGSDSLQGRLSAIKDKFTFDLFSNVCRSTFEKDKLLLAFLFTTRLMLAKGEIDQRELRFLLTGGVGMDNQHTNPAPEWLSDKGWDELCRMEETLPKIAQHGSLIDDFSMQPESFKHIYDSNESHREHLPEPWDSKLDEFHKILLIRCIRPDKVVPAITMFVEQKMGKRYVEPVNSSLADCFADSAPSIPLLFILSQGSDPLANLFSFADSKGIHVETVSMGQGQGPVGERLVERGKTEGFWVVLQNCHLAKSFMPQLEAICESGIRQEGVSKDFRLWLTSYPSEVFPLTVLETAVKMTSEAPTGLRAGLLRTYTSDPVADKDFFYGATKSKEWRNMLFGLAYFHTLIQERRKFGPVGFNIPYDFNQNDLRISVRQLKMFLDEFEDVPFETLRYTCGECNYGGKVTDANDRRTLMTLLNDFYCPEILNEGYPLDESGKLTVPSSTDYNGYVEYIKALPVTGDASAYGLHENAELAKDVADMHTFLDTFMLTQSRGTGAGGHSIEDSMYQVATDILGRLPDNFDIERAERMYPVDYYESMNTVIVQELVRANALLQTIRDSLVNLRKALKGFIIMSEELEGVGEALYDGKVPEVWKKRSFPSLKPLGAYVNEVIERCQFFKRWVNNGVPNSFPLPHFFFTQAFLTAAKQNFARKYRYPIDEVELEHHVLDTYQVNEISAKPKDGVYVYGLIFDSAKWDYNKHCLREPEPKQLTSECPILWMEPRKQGELSQFQCFVCPLYKTPERRGVLSTTGYVVVGPSFKHCQLHSITVVPHCLLRRHSTNHVTDIRLPTEKPARHWLRRGAALLLTLRS